MNKKRFVSYTLRITRPVILICTVFMMFACAIKPQLEDQGALELNNNLQQLDQWRLKGKIAWISPTKRQSAYINWRQNKQAMDFTLSTILGINAASLIFDGKIAKLEADGNTYFDTSPSQLILQTTGWDIPIQSLQHWIKGASTDKPQKSAKNTMKISRFENGLVSQIISSCPSKRFSCSPWQIDYKAYKLEIINGIEYQLPSSIILTNLRSNALIKIRVNEWSE